MIGRYKMSDGCIYEVYAVQTGKGKAKQTHYEMKCVEGSKAGGEGYPTTQEYFERLKEFNLVTKL